MTLILSQVSWRLAIQVGDRLVTKAGKSFDPIANKNILYIGPDGIISLGYTGLAYLEGIPTDQWIVEKMTGLFYERGKRTGALRMGRLPRWPTIGLAVRGLRKELDDVFFRSGMPQNARDIFFEVAGTGWQWSRRGRSRPVLLGLKKKKASDHFELEYEARHIGREFLISATPDENAALLDEASLKGQFRKIRSADEAERVLVNAIRDVASRRDVVGKNCMSILLPPPGLHTARVRYVGEDVSATLSDSREDVAQSMALPAAFSPWIIGATGVHAPSILSGNWTFNVGQFEVKIEAPEFPGPGSRGGMGSIERPPAPQ
jgi:hypothetical protein